MIKAHYGPSDEDLTEQVLQKLPPHKRDDQHRFSVMETLMCLRTLGYDITTEVEIHGKMEDALRSLGGDTSNYVKRERPKRHN